MIILSERGATLCHCPQKVADLTKKSVLSEKFLNICFQQCGNSKKIALTYIQKSNLHFRASEIPRNQNDFTSSSELRF